MNNELIKTYNIGLAADSPGDWYDHLEFVTVIKIAFNLFSLTAELL